MPLLHESDTSSGEPQGPATPRTPADAERAARFGRGRRRGARVRAAATTAGPRLSRRARRNAWDVEALRLPAPLLSTAFSGDDRLPDNGRLLGGGLLTGSTRTSGSGRTSDDEQTSASASEQTRGNDQIKDDEQIRDGDSPGPDPGRTGSRNANGPRRTFSGPDDDLSDTAEWQHDREFWSDRTDRPDRIDRPDPTVHAIDLSDGPKVIRRPDADPYPGHPGHPLDLPGDLLDRPGGPFDFPGDLLDLPGDRPDLPGDPRDLPGDLRDLPSDALHFPGAPNFPADPLERPADLLNRPGPDDLDFGSAHLGEPGFDFGLPDLDDRDFDTQLHGYHDRFDGEMHRRLLGTHPAHPHPADPKPVSCDADSALDGLTQAEAAGIAGTSERRPVESLEAWGTPIAPRGHSLLPDPIHRVTQPPRLPEAMLAAVLSVVALVAAWGTPAPGRAWIALAVLPAVGLLSMLVPGDSWARVLRAGALLTVAAVLPLLAPTMTPVTLVIALTVAATYPMLTGALAGRIVTGLAAVALALPLLAEAFGGRIGDSLVIDPDAGAVTAIRLALGSGILVVGLIGGSATLNRRVLSGTAAIALARERTARAATARVALAAGSDHATGLPNREALLRGLTIALGDRDLDGVTSSGSMVDAEDLGDHYLSAPTRDSRPADEAPTGHRPSARRNPIEGRHTRPTGRIGLLLVDIDRFAELADSLGATVADELATQVAFRLAAVCPATRPPARVGRHQFALLLPTAGDDLCARTAREVTAALAEPVSAAGHEIAVTCSIGAVLSGPGLDTADDLLQAADEAVRAAARTGSSGWTMFDPAIRTRSRHQAGLALELRDAVRQGLIEVEYQPVLALGTGTTAETDDRIVGVEALARWTRADGSSVEPLRFIPLADELGLGVALGLQLIEQALAALVIWRHEGVGVDQVWVNLSPSQLNDSEFAHEVAAQLAIRGLAASSLVLEISAAQLPESKQALATLGLLRSLGIAVALDDFGDTGSSLAALRRLPISAVKLGPAVTAELGANNTLAGSVTQLCRTLGLRVIAEGVETVVHLRGAREIGVDAVQGFVVARPMPAHDITNLLTLRLPRDFRLR